MEKKTYYVFHQDFEQFEQSIHGAQVSISNVAVLICGTFLHHFSLNYYSFSQLSLLLMYEICSSSS
jgi:hypothetical protein